MLAEPDVVLVFLEGAPLTKEPTMVVTTEPPMSVMLAAVAALRIRLSYVYALEVSAAVSKLTNIPVIKFVELFELARLLYKVIVVV